MIINKNVPRKCKIYYLALMTSSSVRRIQFGSWSSSSPPPHETGLHPGKLLIPLTSQDYTHANSSSSSTSVLLLTSSSSSICLPSLHETGLHTCKFLLLPRQHYTQENWVLLDLTCLHRKWVDRSILVPTQLVLTSGLWLVHLNGVEIYEQLGVTSW